MKIIGGILALLAVWIYERYEDHKEQEYAKITDFTPNIRIYEMYSKRRKRRINKTILNRKKLGWRLNENSIAIYEKYLKDKEENK